MGKNKVDTQSDTSKTTPNKPSKSQPKSKNKNYRTKPPISPLKHENHNEEQVNSSASPSSIIKTEPKNQKQKLKEEDNDDAVKNENPLYKFPMNRISRIIKAESDARITQEAIFLVNKASEKFIQLFSTEAYACSFLDKKKHISYQHLSSAVCKQKRFDFLSDFVPEKVKVEDALKEMPSVET